MTKRRIGAMTVAIIVASVLALVAPQQASALTPPTACGTRVKSCALPFPSMDWLRVDRSTPTGFRAQNAPGLIPEALLSQLGPGARLSDILNNADGFSPLTPIVFELPKPVDPASVPGDGGEVVKVFDLDTGAAVPIRAEVSKYATEDFKSSTIVLAWPLTRLDYATRYFAAVTDVLHAADGSKFAAETSNRAVASATRSRRASTMWSRLQAATIDPHVGTHAYVQSTSFVTRSEQNVTGDLDRLAAKVRADDHPIRGIHVGPSLLGGAALVTGQVRVTDFRDAHGVIASDGTATGHPLWIDFTMVMPDHAATPAGVPLVIYGHGLTAFKETEFLVASDNARRGMATIGIDMPNHGSRVIDGGALLDLARPRDLGRLLSMPLQGVLDELSLLQSITTHFSTLDVSPLRWWSNSWGDGVPDLDVSHVLYEGTSMGGVLGLTFLALAPEVDAAFLQVPGAGTIDILFHSILWQVFKRVTPIGAGPGDAHALIVGAAMLADSADATFYLDRIKQRGTPLYLVYGENDGVVPNFATDRIIALTGVPVVGPQPTPSLAGTVSKRIAAMPPSGSGAEQIPTEYLDGNALKPLLAHISFSQPEAIDALDSWLDARIATMKPE